MSVLLLIYQLFFPLVALGILLGIAFSGRGRALREGAAEVRQRFGLIPLSAAEGLHEGGRRLLWVHAASVGEVIAAAPLLKVISEKPNAPRIIITATTVAGRDKARSIATADAAFLAPMDFYPAVRTFLRRVRPDALILVETELWPMTLTLAAAAGVKIGMANGRMREKTYRRYRSLGGFFRSLLIPFSRAALQTPEAAQRFSDLGLPQDAIRVTGNIKYDQQAPSPQSVLAARKRLDAIGWQGAPIWVAGSTRRGEEEILIESHRLASAKVEGLRFILAPRHPERAREAEKVLREAGIRFVRWSEPLTAEKAPECLLIDELGVLASLYSCAGAAFVGGTLVDIGGHNILEPAVSGVPVLFGPHTGSVSDVADGLVEAGGGRVVSDAATLASALQDWIPDGSPRERALSGAVTAASRFSGATQRTLEHLSPLVFGTESLLN